MDFKDDIVAISSPTGMGAISLIRVSGEKALEKVNPFFRTKSGKKLLDMKSHSMIFGEFTNGDELIDEVVVSFFDKDKSYTGQQTVEISCHGSTFIQKKILLTLLERKIRLAKPGEFTMRSFLSGKMDLTQAEAVSDLIYSDSSSMHKIALSQMRGGFQNDLQALREELLHFVSMIELELDFSEEDVDFANKSELKRLIKKVKEKVENLKESFKYGNAIKNGVPVAIAGKPNSGKSSLLNTLLNEQKAIVSDIPGTTRDAVEDVIIIGGIKYRFIDTAGLRKTKDIIESKGIEITKSKISEASVLLYLFDINDTNELEILNDLKEFNRQDLKIILIQNKVDLENNSVINLKNILKKSIDFGVKEIIQISALEKKSVEKLKKNISNTFQTINHSGDTVVTNIRHYEFLSQALISLEEVDKGLENNISGDLLSIDLRKVVDSIGEITGQITNDEMLGNIFSNFCIGK